MRKITTEVPGELAERYEDLAEPKGHTRDFCVLQAVEEPVGRLEYEHRTLATVADTNEGYEGAAQLDEHAFDRSKV